ncbi:hypothetical protein M0Q50_08930 [bacterium]|nr:hypothetical protein [bacterium]
MIFLSMILRLLSIPVLLIGVYTCVIIIGFPIIGLATDMNVWVDKLEKI